MQPKPRDQRLRARVPGEPKPVHPHATIRKSKARQRLLRHSWPGAVAPNNGRRLKIIKLNIGNLAAFGLTLRKKRKRDMIHQPAQLAGYLIPRAFFAARRRSWRITTQEKDQGVTLEDIYVGNMRPS